MGLISGRVQVCRFLHHAFQGSTRFEYVAFCAKCVALHNIPLRRVALLAAAPRNVSDLLPATRTPSSLSLLADNL